MSNHYIHQHGIARLLLGLARSAHRVRLPLNLNWRFDALPSPGTPPPTGGGADYPAPDVLDDLLVRAAIMAGRNCASASRCRT
ncbi:MAG: hypothetical protein U0232_03665 [Thermomicrobiales bacterium]